MKTVIIAALLLPLSALAQTYPSPTFSSLTLQNPLTAANGGTGATTSTGTGAAVLSNSPTLVTPNLGTPSAITLTNGSGLPISTGVSGLGAGVASSLGNAVTGSGSIVLSTSPTLTTPNLGTPSSVTLTNGTGLPVSTGVSGLGTGVATGLSSAATGSGGPVLAISPTIASPTITGTLNAPGIVTPGSLATQAANTILGNATGSTASPTAIAVPSCSTSSSALGYTSASGITCNSSINAATLGGATFAAPGPIGSTTRGIGAFTTIAANAGGSVAGGLTVTSGLSTDTLSASGAVSGVGFSNYLASPPAIGGTAPAAGSFTNLSATNAVTSSAFDSGGANFRATSGSYGAMLRNDGTNVYLLQTASGSPSGSFNSYRPFSWSLSSGAVSIDGTGAGTTFGGPLSSTAAYGFHVGTVSSMPPDIGGGQNPVYYSIIDADTAAAGTGFLLGNETRLLFGSSSSTGGRIAQYNYLQQNAVTSSSNTNHNYVGTQSEVTSATGDGGTNLTTGAKGAYFGYATDARLNTGATNVLELTGGEIDTVTQTGTSMKYLVGWSIVGNNTVQGTNLDAAIDIGGNNQQGDGHSHAGWNFGIAFDDIHGYSPVNGNSTLLGGSFPTLGTQTILYGINLQSFSCSTACFASNNFAVLQNGTINTAGINGVTNGAVATSGTIGQQLNNSTSGVSLTSGTAANGTSISVGPGQYYVQCTAQFNPAGSTTINTIIVGVNTVSATLPGYAGQTTLQASFTAGNFQVISSPMVYENLTAGSTTLYCPIFSGFGTSTMTANTTINVLRVH